MSKRSLVSPRSLRKRFAILNSCAFEALESRRLFSGSLRVIDERFVYDAARQSLQFTFNNNVSSSFSNSDVTLTNLTTGTSIMSSSLTVTFPQANVAKIEFPTIYLADGSWHAVLSANGANQVFDFSFYAGDATFDGSVDIRDLSPLASNFGQSGKTYSQGDFNYDGTVNSTDLGILSSKWNTTTFNVGINSDNTGASGNADEDIEENPNKPGKIITVDNGDVDSDGIPDFADGYDLDGTSSDDDTAYGLVFEPIVFQVPTGTNISTAKVKLYYDGSDPSGVTGTVSDGLAPDAGSLRIWKNLGAVRSLSDYVASSTSGTEYTPSQLGFSGTVVTLYVEAVRPSDSMADKAIKLELYPDGNTSNPPKYVDTVRLTAVNSTPADHGDPNSDRPGGTAFGADGGDPASLNISGAVRYSDGTVSFTSRDLDPAEGGILSGQTRTWSSIPSRGAGSANGNGWTDSQLPSLVDSGNSVIVVSGGRASQWFDYTGSQYQPRSFGLDALAPTGAGEFLLTDTLGNQFYFYDFSITYPAKQRGQLHKYVDSAGNETDLTYNSSGQVTSAERMPSASDANPTVPLERLTYHYTDGLVDLVTMERRQDSLGDPTTLAPIRRVAYTYYGASDTNGNPGDLKQATVEQYDGSNWFAVEHKIYRYDGFSRLSLVLEGAAYERAVGDSINVLTASSSTLATYANYVFDYYAPDDSNALLRNKIKSQTIQGKGQFNYDYLDDNGSTSPNAWQTKTIEYLPDNTPSDNSDNDARIIYSNSAYETLANIFLPAGVTDEVDGWTEAYRYDSEGRLIEAIMPSAVAPTASTSNYPVTLRSGAGLIYTMDYVSSGDGAGFLGQTGRKRGEAGTVIAQEAYTYSARPSAAATSPTSNAFVLETDNAYRDDAGSQAVVTSYDYTYTSGTDHIEEMVTTLPDVSSSSQNGAGATSTAETQTFDVYGRELSFTDGDGKRKETTYFDPTGAVQEVIEDQGSGGLNLTTSYESDLLGRTTSITDPKSIVQTISYVDTAALKIITVMPPVTSGGQPSPPAQVTREDRATGTIDLLELQRNSSGVLTGAITKRTQNFLNPQQQVIATERYADTSSLAYNTSSGAITGTGSRYRTEFGYDVRGHQDRVSAGRDLYVSTMAATNPTITRTVYDGLDRPIQTWIGTSDSGWTPSSPGSNMTLLSANEYDGGSIAGGDVGDSNLTKVTQFPDTTSSHNRVNEMGYDWRDRLVATKRGVESSESTSTNRPILYVKYDNLDRGVAQYIFDGDTIGIADGNSDGVPDQPSSALMRSATVTQYDDRGRVFRSTTFNVDQSSGVGSGSAISTDTADQFSTMSASTIASLGGLRTDNWFDDRDNVIKTQQPGGLVIKTVYDGVSRPIIQYTTDGGGDSGYSSASNVTGDLVLEQVETTYDENDNAILVVTKQRWHDAEGTADLEPANADIFNTSNPNARVSFVTNYYDEANRLVTTVDYGNNGDNGDSDDDGIVDFARPSGPPTRAGTDGWDPFLRSDFLYNDQGYLDLTTDPRGIQARTFYDSLGRKIQLLEAYDASAGLTVDTNRKTLWTYNGYDQVTSVANTTYDAGAGARTLTTSYSYGVTKDSKNFINSTQLLKSITYGAVTGAPSGYTDVETFSGYNALGELTEKTERNTTVHAYTINVLGQMTADTWTNNTSGTNTYVQNNLISTWAGSLQYGYDALGRGIVFTTKDGNGTTVNEVKRDYDGLGHLVTEWQEHSGAVTSGTAKVQYAYDTDYANNFSRQVQLIYPNGRVLSYVYGYDSNYNSSSFNDTLNDQISRVGYIADGASPTSGSRLETYDYLGLNRVIIRDYPNATGGIGLSYWNDALGSYFNVSPDQDDAGSHDPYNGLDRFGRVVEQSWGPEDRTFAYDADSNLLYERINSNNLQESWKSSLYHAPTDTAATAYDKLNRMKAFYRGKLTIGGSGTYNDVDQSDPGVPNEFLSQTFDATSGTNFNWQRTDSSADPGRSVYQKLVPLNPFVPSPTPSASQRDVFVKFDGWGRLATQANATLSDFGQTGSNWQYQRIYAKNYTYDALGRRIMENYTNDNTSIHLYYDAAGNIIEDQFQNGSSTPTTQNQYVFSAADPGQMVVRDRDDDSSSSTGNFGKSGSGLELRVSVMQGPDGSVWRIREQGGSSIAYEQFLYDSQGKMTLVRRSSAGFGDYQVGLPNSQYSWRNFWRDGRASIDQAPADPNDLSNATDIEVYDGLLYFPGAGEHDTLKGAPVAEDVYAYVQALNKYSGQTAVNTQLGGNGTTDTFTHPAGSGGWDTMWDAFWSPSHYGSMGQVTTPTWMRGVQLAGVLGLSALTGGAAAAGLGALGASAGVIAIGSGFAGGFVGSFAQNSAMQLEMVGGEGYSFGQAALSGLEGGAIGGISGGVLYGLNVFVNDAITSGRVIANYINNTRNGAMQVVGGGARVLQSATAAAAMSGSTAGIAGGIGSNVFMSVMGNDPEVIRDAIRNGAIRPVSSYRAGTLARQELHHIASNKGASKYLFLRIFKNAGMDLEHHLNKLYVVGHQGPHGIAYNLAIYDRLATAVAPYQPGTVLYRYALRSELKRLASELTEHGGDLNLLVRFPG